MNINFKTVRNSVSRTMNNCKFTVKKYSPEILLAGGIIFGVATVITACRSTTKLNAIMDKAEDDNQLIEKCINNPDKYIPEDESYTLDDAKRDKIIVKKDCILSILKNYSIPIACGIASVTCILGSHKIMKSRNAALSVAVNMATEAFNQYRSRVIETLGKDVDDGLMSGKLINKADEQKPSNNKDDGKNPYKNINSPYTFIFDEKCALFDKTPGANLTNLQLIEYKFNEQLERKGHVFLNDVLEELGMDIVDYGQYTGWVYDDKNPHKLSFGIFENLFEDGCRKTEDLAYERSFLLTFNCDGYIMDDTFKYRSKV